MKKKPVSWGIIIKIHKTVKNKKKQLQDQFETPVVLWSTQ